MEEINFFLQEQDFHFVQSFQTIPAYDFRSPQINWVWSTYYRLKSKGHQNIRLTHTVPEKGIVVIASNQTALLQKFPKDVFVISTVADSPPRFFTHINITQNPLQPADYPNVFKFPVWKHISHWPQPKLIIRNTQRGNRFENVGFFGNIDQIDPVLLDKKFHGEMEAMGLTFQVIDKDYNDYSNIDCVLAVRSFSENPFFNKPYSKLINAWFAQVPIIVGEESSFQAIKKSELDFVSAGNIKELLEALRLLKNNPSLRQRMVANGIKRSEEFSEDLIQEHWEDFLFNVIPDYYNQWKKKGILGRNIFFADLLVSRTFRSIKKRILNKINGRINNTKQAYSF